jgi:type II secretion system protein N
MTAALQGWRRLAAASTLTTARDALRRLAPVERAPLILYALYTVALFLVFLVVTFPHELLVRRILDRAGTGGPVTIEVSGVHLGWSLAYTFDELRLLERGGDPGVPLLTASAVRAAPSLLGLVRGEPYPLGIRADLYGGTLTAVVDPRPAAFHVRVALASVDVGRYGGLRLFMEGRLSGRVDGTIELRGDARKPSTTNGQVELRAAGLAVEGGKVRGITVPDLHFTELRLAGAMKAGRLELGELRAHGQEVNLRGQGSVLLQQPPVASLMNLDLTLVPADAIPDGIRLALNLIPGEPAAGGERRIRLYGSIGQPHIGR